MPVSTKKPKLGKKVEKPEPVKPSENPEMVAPVKFAVEAGYSVSTIYTFIHQGKLNCVKDGGRRFINRKQGLEEIKLIAKKGTSFGPLGSDSDDGEEKPKGPIITGDLGKGPVDRLSEAMDSPVPTTGMSYHQARAHREAYEARNKELEFRRKAGMLIDRKEVESRAFESARLVRDALLGIADRIAAEVAAERDVNKVHTKISDAINTALESLSHGAPELEGVTPKEEPTLEASSTSEAAFNP